jgi:hypothetical protein
MRRKTALFIGVLPVPSASENTGNGRTRAREAADSRRVLGDVEEDVVTLVHERELMVVEEELTAMLDAFLGTPTRTPISPSFLTERHSSFLPEIYPLPRHALSGSQVWMGHRGRLPISPDFSSSQPPPIFYALLPSFCDVPDAGGVFDDPLRPCGA